MPSIAKKRKVRTKRSTQNSRRRFAYVPRDPVLTRRRILDIAISEFSNRGFNGARVENIAKSADVNMRMIYHYFKSKKKLYIAAIEEVYHAVRATEQDIHFEDDEDPIRGLARLVDYTFTHFSRHPELISIVMNENLLHAKYLKQTQVVPTMAQSLSNAVRRLLRNGYERGVFCRNPDPVQLWLTIFSLCWVHLSNRYTMSWTLQIDLADREWIEMRRKHVADVILTYLCTPSDHAHCFSQLAFSKEISSVPK